MYKTGQSKLIDSLLELKRINDALRPENIDKRAREVCDQIFPKQANIDGIDEAIRALCDEVDKQIENNIRAL